MEFTDAFGWVMGLMMTLSGETPQTLPEKFAVQGNRLIYDTESIPDVEIERADVGALKEVLQQYPQISVVELNSGGGRYYPARDMARVITDYQLDTHVNGECISSCVLMLLAGEVRSMARGSEIGFHQTSWDAGDIEAYYERFKDRNDWESPFEFASWVYQDTQTAVNEHLEYMIDRGVDPVFAIHTIRNRGGDIWSTERAALMAGGVLRETAKRSASGD